jgi:hypothetical protein
MFRLEITRSLVGRRAPMTKKKFFYASDNLSGGAFLTVIAMA